MTLTPLDIHNKEFHRALRGYSEAEVDEFLDQVGRDLEALVKENAAVREQLGVVSTKLEHYQSLEETLRSTLVIAQGTAEELKASARKEADLIVREAQLEGERVIKATEARLRQLRQTFDDLQKQTQVYRAKVRSFLETQLELISADWGLDHGLGAAAAAGGKEAVAGNGGDFPAEQERFDGTVRYS